MKVLLYPTSHRREHHFQEIAENMPAEIDCTVFGHNQKLPTPNFSFFSEAKEIDMDDVIKYDIINRELKKAKTIPATVKQLYKYYGLMRSLQLANVLKSQKYDLVIIWNGYAFKQRLIAEVAKKLNIRVAYMENGLLPNTTTLDCKGINYNNSLPRDTSFYKSLNNQKPFIKPDNLVVRRAVDKETISEQQSGIPENYIFVPFQVDNDTQIVCNSPYIKNMEELFFLCAEVQKKTKRSKLKICIQRAPFKQI